MKKIMSILLSIVMSTSLVIPTFAEAPPYSIDKVATKVVIDQHELRDIYDKYASVTDETVVEEWKILVFQDRKLKNYWK